jgi:integrase
MADRVLAAVRKMMNWYAARDDDFMSPIVPGMGRTKPRERARKRVLSDDEIRALWAGLDRLDALAAEEGEQGFAIFAALVRLLLLTAQRREEVAGMRRSEIEGDLWTIPPDRHKTGTSGDAKVVPLSRRAQTLLCEIPAEPGCDLVFTTNWATPFSGFSKGKRRLDAAMLSALRSAAELRSDARAIAATDELEQLIDAAEAGNAQARQQLKTKWWTFHDLRRTAKTLMMRAGVRPDISERVLGHVIPGVEGVYDRHDYIQERGRAVEQLAEMIDKILTPAHNVVPFARTLNRRA